MNEDEESRRIDAAVWAAVNLTAEQRKQLSSSGVNAQEIRKTNNLKKAKALQDLAEKQQQEAAAKEAAREEASKKPKEDSK